MQRNQPFDPMAHEVVLRVLSATALPRVSPRAAGNLAGYLTLAGDAVGNPDRETYFHLAFRICFPHRGHVILRPLVHGLAQGSSVHDGVRLLGVPTAHWGRLFLLLYAILTPEWSGISSKPRPMPKKDSGIFIG